MDTLAFLLSALGAVCIYIPPLLKGKNMKQILLLTFLSNVFIATSYVLTGAINGAVSCFLGAVQVLINYFFQRKALPLPRWLVGVYGLTFTVVNLVVFTNATDILAILACLTFILCISQQNGKGYRLWSLGNASLWLIYDGLNVSFGPLATHAIQFAIIICGMVMHDRKKIVTGAEESPARE